MAPAFPAVLLWFPGPALTVLMLTLMSTAVRARAVRRRHVREAEADVIVLAELVSVGLAAGLGFSAVLRRAAEGLAPEIRQEVADVLRAATTTGLAAALTMASGRCRGLFRLAARAVDTGAPVGAAAEAFVDDAIDEQRSNDLANARRLPVKLVFPLAFLILPGFMLLTVGPAVLSSGRRLGL